MLPMLSVFSRFILSFKRVLLQTVFVFDAYMYLISVSEDDMYCMSSNESTLELSPQAFYS